MIQIDYISSYKIPVNVIHVRSKRIMLHIKAKFNFKCDIFVLSAFLKTVIAKYHFFIT